MQTGEVLRRVAYNALDTAKGGKMNRLLDVNMYEIVYGITPDYEQRRISYLLAYAKKHCPYYRNVKGASLECFPVMNKMLYNEHRDEVISDEYADKKESLAQLNTSGSTGVPFTVYADPLKMDHVFMNMMSVYMLNGFRMGMKRGEFRVWIEGRNALSPFRSFKNNIYMYDISNMGDDSLARIAERLKKERIQCVVAYSSALTALVGYIRRANIDVSDWDVEMIYSMGEAMPDSTYEAIEETFGFPPVRSYGNNENGFIAIGLNDEKRYTVDLYNYYIEILQMDSDEPALPGELGRIVVTDYYNRAFPMIRYDTGDTGRYEKVVDEKGRCHGYFTDIYGRRGSILYNTKGEPLSPHVFMNVLLKLEGKVHQAKCIQLEKDRFELILNVDKEKADIDEVVGMYRRYLGDDAVIDITYVDEIPVQASGKRLVCEQRCPEYL